MPLESGSTFQLNTRTSFKIQFLFFSESNKLIYYSPHYNPTTNYFYQFRANHLWNYRKSDIERTLLIAKKREREKSLGCRHSLLRRLGWDWAGDRIWTLTMNQYPTGRLAKANYNNQQFFGGNENSNIPE